MQSNEWYGVLDFDGRWRSFGKVAYDKEQNADKTKLRLLRRWGSA